MYPSASVIVCDCESVVNEVKETCLDSMMLPVLYPRSTLTQCGNWVNFRDIVTIIVVFYVYVYISVFLSAPLFRVRRPWDFN